MCVCVSSLKIQHFKLREMLHKSYFLCIYEGCFACVEGLQQLIILVQNVLPCLGSQLVVLDCLTACLSIGLSLLHLNLFPCLSNVCLTTAIIKFGRSLHAFEYSGEVIPHFFPSRLKLQGRNLAFSCHFLIQVDL